jgi:3-oxoacyl-[acyl-carrier protein] reductase
MKTKEQAVKQRVALVTGGSRGIGRAIALALAQDGMIVAVHYNRQQKAAEEVVGEIHRLGGKGFTLQGDVGSVSSISALYTDFDAGVRLRTGEEGFDVLVNNAGIGLSATVEETTEELFDQLFAVNAKGPFFMIREALPRLRNNGRIINMSSCVTRLAYPEVAAYSASKATLNILTTLLASQLGPRGITVNAVAPGVTYTDMNAEWLKDRDARRTVEQETALGRIGKPEDMVGLVSFLASPKSAWVTGQLIEASGGIRL